MAPAKVCLTPARKNPCTDCTAIADAKYVVPQKKLTMESARYAREVVVFTIGGYLGKVRRKPTIRHRMHPLFDGLDARKTTRKYKKGDVIFREGQQPVGLFHLLQGKVKVFKTGDEGREQIVRLFRSGDVLGYRALASNEPYFATATALEPCNVVLIPIAEVHAMLDRSGGLALLMLRQLGQDLKDAEDRLLDFAQKPVKERLMETLHLLRDTYGDVDGEAGLIDIELTREDLASMVGTATETLIRAIHDLKEEARVETVGRRIRVI
jgi:CRP-like cAMP-binding protein